MVILRKYIAFVLVMFAFGCANEKHEVQRIDFAKAVKEAQTLKMSKYFSSIEYIPLQTNEESLLGNVLLFSGGNGQYNFASPGDEIRCFNHKGEFKGKIGTRGRGLNEYFFIQSLVFDEKLGNTSVLTREKILVYDQELDLIDNISLQQVKDIGVKYIDDFMLAQNGYVILTSKQDSLTRDLVEHCVLLNGNGTVEAVINVGELYRTPMLMMGKEGTTLANSKLYKGMDGTVHLVKGDFETIYRLNGEEKSVAYNIDFGKYGDLRHNSNPREKLFFAGARGCDNFFLLLFIFPDSYFSTICGGGNVKSVGFLLYDNKESQVYAMKNIPKIGMVAFENDLDGGLPFFPQWFTSDGKCVWLVDAIDFVEYASMYDNPQMKEIAATLTEESNPVLVVATLK